MADTCWTTMPSPLGELLLTSDGKALTGLHLSPHERAVPATHGADDVLDEARAQLDEYFTGARTQFELPLAPDGTPFQLSVWQGLRDIPYAETISYGELARRIGRPGAARAVGLANGRNPIAIVVPCHRVIGADGSLTGYGGGLERKQVLLDLERGVVAQGITPGAPGRRSAPAVR
jgi:methylated-DNA-[protein]-cysteine S-methyltransferase